MATLLPEGKQSFTNSAGAPLAGGKIYTYDAGTSTPRPTYQDAAGAVPNPNPVVLDARGEATVFWSGAYKVVLKDASDVTVWTVDNVVDTAYALTVYAASIAGGAGSSLVGYLPEGTGAVLGTVQATLRERVSVKGFGAKGDGLTDDTAAIQSAINHVQSKGGGTVFFPHTSNSFYRITAALVLSGGAEICLQGDGQANIRIFATTSVDAIQINVGTNVQKSYVIVLDSLQVWGGASKTTSRYGLNAEYVTNLRVRNCSFYQHGSSGIRLNNTYTFHATDTESVGNNAHGVEFSGAAANNSLLSRCKFIGNNSVGGAGVYILGQHYNPIIDSCDFEFNYYGVWQNGCRAWTVRDCYFEGQTQASIFVPPASTSEACCVQGNAVLNSRVDINGCAGGFIEANDFFGTGVQLSVLTSPGVRIGSNALPSGGTISVDTFAEYQAIPAWQTYACAWTATTTNPSIGNGSVVAYFKQVGKTVNIRLLLLMGSTTTFGSGTWLFSLPTAARTVTLAEWYGSCTYTHSATRRPADLTPVISSGLSVVSLQNPDGSNVTPSSPITWASGDSVQVNIQYEAA